MSAIKRVENSPVTLDEILMKFSLCGRYYAGFMLMIVLLFMNDSINCGGYLFTASEVKYWCADERFGNDSCASLSKSTEVCTEWVYDDPHSFVAEFQLACQDWKRTLVGTLQGLGYGVGLLFIGPLSDRLGRKTLVVVTAVTNAVLGVSQSFSSNYWIFVVLEFLRSTLGNVYSPAYILAIEMVAHEKRVLTKVLCCGAATLSYVILPLVAWLVPYWRQLLLILYGPAFIFIIYIFTLDESPRWLLNKGRKEKAIAILESTAKSGKVKLDRNDLENLIHENKEEVTFVKSLKDTFSSKLLLKRFCMCLILWICCVFVNYGIRIHSVSLPGSKYLNFGLVGIVNIPARVLTYWVLAKFTRKICLVTIFLLAAVVCVAQAFTPENIQWLSILLLMIGRLLITTVSDITYIFTSELFPTYTRNSVHSICSAVGRVGSILAPQIPLLMVYWHGLPSLTFSLVSLLAGILSLFAPDTADEVLPNTVEEAEAFSHRRLAKVANKEVDQNVVILNTIDITIPTTCFAPRVFERRVTSNF